MKKKALILIIITIMTSIFGFAKSIALAYYYGASSIADVYVIATTIPTLFFAFFGIAVKSGVIPIYNQIVINDDVDDAHYFLNNLISLLTILLIFCALFIFLFSNQLVEILAPGLSDNSIIMASSITRITAFSIILQGVTAILQTYLNIKNKFTIAALSIMPLNIIILLSIILSAEYGFIYLAYGFLVGTLAQTLMLVFVVIKNKYSFKLTFKPNDLNIKKFLILIAPILLSVIVNDINIMIDKALASQVVIGGVSALNYSQRLVTFIQSTIIISISTIAFPQFSKYYSEKNMSRLKGSIIDNLKLVLLIIFPIVMGVVFYSSEIVELIYGRGAFDESARKFTSIALIYYSIGIIGFGLNSIFTRYFYAIQKSTIPMIGALMSATVNLTLNLVFYNYTNMGIGGIALSTSIATLINSIWLGTILRKELGKIVNNYDLVYFIKIIISSILMIFVTKCVQNNMLMYIEVNKNLLTILVVVLAAILYFMTLLFVNVKEVMTVTKQFIKIFYKRKS